MQQPYLPTGTERFFARDQIIVSKTDPKGRLTYVNKTFIDIAGYNEEELLGQPHSIIRHPDMPRCIFRLLWETIESRREIFAYVVNLCKNGDHYWVLAHVTPSYNADGQLQGFHSNRRVPNRKVLDTTILPLYRQLCAEEERHKNKKDGMRSATIMLGSLLREREVEYDEFIFSLKS